MLHRKGWLTALMEREKKYATIFKLLLIIVMSTVIVACGTPVVGSIADMSGYEGLDDKGTQVFIVSDVKDFLKRLDEKQTFAAYFGFASCPWCNDAIDILNEVALKAGVQVCYINTRPTKKVKANCEIPDYDMLVERVGKYLGKDGDGNPYLYVPIVFFVKAGEIMLVHEGTVEGYMPEAMEIPQDYKEKVKQIYREGFESIK